MRRVLAIVAAAGLLVLSAGAAHARADRFVETHGLVVLAMPEAEGNTFLDRHGTALGLGVYPTSRAPADLIAAIGRGGPDLSEEPTTAGPGQPGRIGSLLPERRGAVVPSMRDSVARGVLDALTIEPAPLGQVLRQGMPDDVVVLVVRRAEDAEAALRIMRPPRRGPWDGEILVLAVGERTPVTFGLALPFASDGPDAVLAGSETRRTGVATPYDLAATILAGANGDPSLAAGRVLGRTASDAPRVALADLAERMERGHDFEEPLTKATVAFGLAGLLPGTLALALRRRRLAAAFARAASLVPAGYIGSLFLPDASWETRASVIAGAFTVGLSVGFRNTRRFVGWVFMLTGIAIVAVTVLAAREPDGYIAWSLWGDPLVSWRFFGLPNRMVSFLTGGVLVGAGAIGLAWWVALPIAGGAIAVIAAPALGANFVGVLTFAFGAVIATFASIARRVRIWHLPIAIVSASGALIAAMYVDAERGTSHGGRAAAAIRDSGLDTARDILEARARLNLESITDLGAWGAAAFAMAAVALGLLFWWGARSTVAAPRLRAAVAGAAAAGLAALVVEDSGFYTGGILGVFPWVGYLAARADAEPSQLPAASAPPDPVTPVPHEPPTEPPTEQPMVPEDPPDGAASDSPPR